MLEYVKLILEKMSFDQLLFEKELKKGLRMLPKNEMRELQEWCLKHHAALYEATLTRILGTPKLTF